MGPGGCEIMKGRNKGGDPNAGQQWAAECEDEHTPHRRRDPPGQTRTWAVNPVGRARRLGDETLPARPTPL